MVKSKILLKNKACLLKLTGFFVSVVFLLLAYSCDTMQQQGGMAGKIMPNITGGAGEVLVVMDQFNWENSAGELLQDILKEEFHGLPQSEPLFDVVQVTAASFDGVYQFHRTIVLTTVASGLEPNIRFRENIWAKPQIMVQMEAPTGGALKELIGENETQIRSFLVQYDRNRLMNVYKDSKDPAIQKDIANHHQVRLAIPRGYTQKYVKGPRDGSYMVIARLFEPIAYDLKNNNNNVIELRGLWDLENGFMGGPFVSHSVYDSTRGRIVTVDGYIYHPNQKKRIKVKQLEAIIYSMEII
jgi:hypothetical protein